ncbi:MAG: MFS transporter, partial [Anaerolineae bacterium CG_4_9_14_0_8_um_filter_58_9]
MANQRFPWGRTFLLGFGFLGISIIWPIFNQYIPIFLQAGNPEFEARLLAEGREIPDIIGFGLAPSLAMFIMTWDNILNMFIAPWAGAKSDRTWNRLGRRKGWILLGAPIALLAFVFIPVAQSLLAIMTFILITNFGMALFRSPTVAWLGDLFDTNNRSKANGVINLMGGVGGLLAYFGGGMLFNALGRNAPFFAGAVATIVALVTVLIFVREPRQIAVEERESDRGGVLDNVKALFANPNKSGLFVLLSILFWFMAFNALETGLSSFAVFTLGMKAGTASIYTGTMTISFILFAVPAGFFGTRYGRAPIIRIGLIGMVLLTLLGYFIIQGAVTLIIVLVLAGAAWALVNVNSLPLVYDHGDERRIGAYTGLYYFSSQLAAILGPTL